VIAGKLVETVLVRFSFELRKYTSKSVPVGAATFLDVTAHHVFPQIVVNHVTSVTLDEFYLQLSEKRLHNSVFLQPLHRSVLVDFAIDQSSGSLVCRIMELLHQILHGVVFVCA
jgi:hypothetical protein